MDWLFLAQIVGPVLFGTIFMTSEILHAKPRWLGRVLFLLAQLVQIYAMGFVSLLGLGIVLGVLGGFAVCAATPGESPGRRLGAVTAFFTLYVIYWFIEKYLAPFSSGAIHETASLVAVVGISYIGFKIIHFYVDYRAGEISDAKPLDVLNWLLFFPSIVAGPMQRFQDWQEQFGATPLTADRLVWAVRRILIGLVMKVVIADNIYNLTLPHMAPSTLATAPWSAIVLGSLVYSLYLYFDFAGYSHIAIGTGAFWGITLPENFNNPYVARNLAEFWNRWHMTLSHILRDYLFYPMSLKVKRTRSLRLYPVIGTGLPPIVTFLLAGLWHGAGIGYVIYGLLHGIGLAYLAVRRSAVAPRSHWWVAWTKSRFAYGASVAFNYVYVSFTFVFFSLSTEKIFILSNRLLSR